MCRVLVLSIPETVAGEVGGGGIGWLGAWRQQQRGVVGEKVSRRRLRLIRTWAR